MSSTIPRRQLAVLAPLLAAVLAIGPAGTAPASAAPAAGDRLRLTWTAPVGCPARNDVAAAVARLMGTSTANMPGELTATARVRRVDARRWVVRLSTTLSGSQGERELEGDSCQAVASATALILALTLEPNVRADEGSPSSERSPPSSASSPAAAQPADDSVTRPIPAAPAGREIPPAPAPAAAPPSDADRSKLDATSTAAKVEPTTVDLAATQAPPAASLGAPRYQLSLRPFVGLSTVLPAIAAVVGGGVGLQRNAIELAVLGWGSQSRRDLAAERPGAGGDFRVLGVAVRGCGRVAQGWARVGLCAGASLERVNGMGFGVESPGKDAVVLGGGIVAGTITVPIGGRFEAALELTGFARPYHPRFVLSGVGQVFDVPTFGSLAALGVIVNL